MTEKRLTDPMTEPGWQAAHARRYLATDGADGHIWNGVPTLLLSTVGRRSGNAYTTPLIYGIDGDQHLVVASRGGAPDHPQWYKNLVAQPEVEVQILGDRFRARTHTATQEEKPPLWQIMAAIWPSYVEYQTRTTRDIPVVIIERIL